jgi:hypothetical protein
VTCVDQIFGKGNVRGRATRWRPPCAEFWHGTPAAGGRAHREASPTARRPTMGKAAVLLLSVACSPRARGTILT